MSRKRKNVRLWLRPERYDKRTGKIKERATWIIRDGGKYVATGCAVDETGEAERKLAAYIAEKYSPARRERDIESIDIADVLSIYYEDKKEEHSSEKDLARTIEVLAHWWGGKMLSEVNGQTCRAFIRSRGPRGNARQYLEYLRAAINHHAKEGLHRGIVRVVLPPKSPPRDRWLTRHEAAKLIWTCWRARETQTIHRGKEKGKKRPTSKRPLRHIARFILIGLYTGTRASAIASASPNPSVGHSYVDLEQGIFYRLPRGKKRTKKRQTPAPIPNRLRAHMKRWVEKGIAKSHFVEYRGKPVKSVIRGFYRAVELAGLSDDVTPHTLRHTAVTWLLQAGVPIWEVAGFVGMTPDMVEKVYGHHHPDHLSGAVRALARPLRRASPHRNVAPRDNPRIV